jgi:phosphoesterase RecJ-like protein
MTLSATDLSTVPAAVLDRLRGARAVLTVCHENPEADALGSALGVALLVEQLGGRATPVCADVVPPMYSFMPQVERFRQAPEPDRAYDLIVVCDCGDLARIGRVLPDNAALFEQVPIVNIDHHISNTGFGTVNWVDSTAAATCEMVGLLSLALDIPLTAADGALAANLIAGVVIDTANFQHPNTTPRTLRVASELLAAGAPLYDTARLLYRTKPNAQLKLFGTVLGRLASELDGRIVWTTLEAADYARTGSAPADAEGISDLLSQSATGEVIVLFKENGTDTTRISVRTKEGGVDATVLTAAFGGGGHARAAGATVPLPLAAAVPAVLEVARRLVGKSAGGR